MIEIKVFHESDTKEIMDGFNKYPDAYTLLNKPNAVIKTFCGKNCKVVNYMTFKKTESGRLYLKRAIGFKNGVLGILKRLQSSYEYNKVPKALFIILDDIYGVMAISRFLEQNSFENIETKFNGRS